MTAPRGRGTRPTSDRVKEALFSSVQPRLPGAAVADLYAGSGALGIESLSRGARLAVFVERAARAHRALLENLERTGLGQDAVVLHADVRAALRDRLPGAPFDLVLLDPPYDTDRMQLADVLDGLAAVLARDGLVVLEASHHDPVPPWPTDLRPTRTRRYGDTVLHEAVAEGRPLGH
ncbi:MAG: 16S rRNA (guanine(966)-N(2))-methyltransferase RsmD [Actinomycetota bacterium]|nr:16S rRNA (guanine(966)-N(2))-methyltransferase RsmD [Actinomycetota bacterium]